ncbi:YicC-like protein [Gottschalkia acidurici 9a]|uniref:YicC-like protein n=1 Tax=Gottschalkia acidurici (strain ATCC 7906 / DSM 604 / BCRC 14475 / CIP 104303 / KCTC 5404 / NCIMB 10678 / 9a) TaxID=1128398 RepID=K0AY30_GOTA9|nr:YicC/YloC family endoribonuclease [Gottschalkia acidurici]AFS78698.1 YicC-like protein [Gottschalkia acidurici 9a]
MLRSMTGFGRGENNDGIRNFTVEVKSINHRYNDIIVKVPKHISYLEEKIKKEVKKYVTRGRVEIYIGLEYVKDIEMEVKVNIPLAQSYKNALEKICTELNIDSNLNIDLITKFPDILKTERKEEDEDEIWNTLKEGVRIALEELIAMRQEEGELLSKDIKEKTNKIESLINDIEERAPKVVLEYKEKLENRINELLENKYDIDESKLANEVAYFADKTGIDEEIVRFNSHIIQLRKSLEGNDSIGRKLDFMLQEMNREVNTIGSKVGDVEITNKVVDIKTELEKIREQIQNIE